MHLELEGGQFKLHWVLDPAQRHNLVVRFLLTFVSAVSK